VIASACDAQGGWNVTGVHFSGAPNVTPLRGPKPGRAYDLALRGGLRNALDRSSVTCDGLVCRFARILVHHGCRRSEMTTFAMILIALGLFLGLGYLMNIIKLFTQFNRATSGMVILRIVGIFLPFIGCFAGWCSAKKASAVQVT
jgi:hypothetical protein